MALAATCPSRAAAAASGAARRPRAARPAARRAAAKAAAADVKGKLAEALKLAEECVDDCAVAWDNVEELSAASQKAGEQPEAKDAVLPKGAEAFIAETRKQIEAAQAAATFDSNTMKAIEAAAASAGSAIKESAGVDEERLARISAALEEAIAVAQECSDDCATEWDTVEELSAAKKHASE